MSVPSWDEFIDMLDEAISCIPPRFCKDLTGGFNVREETKHKGQYYVLGEYVTGGHLGCFIVFYYGSFVKLLKNKPKEAWEAEIRDTVLHEMQHHLETQAGRDDLARREAAELAQALR